MDYKLDGLLSRYVLVLMLLEVQWRPVFPAPTQTSCDLDRTKDVTDLLKHQVNELLTEYINVFGLIADSVPDDVPDSTISGVNISEKLQNIYVKNGLFDFHISKVKEYLEEHWHNLSSGAGHIKKRLSHHLAKIKGILKSIDPETPLPTTPPPPQVSHDHSYAKKVYGWGVIVALNNWLTQVQQVLEEVNVCDN